MSARVPYYVDDEQWASSPLDPDMVENIHLQSALKPTAAEWEAYFVWLLQVVGYPHNEVDLLRKQKPRQRRVNVRVCMFLHFHRAGIPHDRIVSGQFASPAGWKKKGRKPWKGAAFVVLPTAKKSPDWWCTSAPQPGSLPQKLKICHELQTSEIGADEVKERTEAKSRYLVLGKSIQKAREQAELLLNEAETYKERYADAPYTDMIDKEKQTALHNLLTPLQTALKQVHDEASLQELQKTIDAAYALSIPCYRDAHVAFAAERSRLEEEERQRVQAQREAEERAKREAEEKARREAEAKAKAEEDERLRKEAEAKAAEERKRQEAARQAEELARQEAAKKLAAEEAERRAKEAEEAERRAKQAAAAQMAAQEAQAQRDREEAERKSLEDARLAQERKEEAARQVNIPKEETAPTATTADPPQEQQEEVKAEVKEEEEQIKPKPAAVAAVAEQANNSPKVVAKRVAIPLPYYLDEEQWEKSPLDPDMMENIHLQDELKPTAAEWEEYFVWLLQVVGYPHNEVDLLRKQKLRQRRINVRVCMFLHFFRAGIPTERMVSGQFASPAGWKKKGRKPWKGASFINLPTAKKSPDWWCTSVPQPSSLAQKLKICHELQTSEIGVDEEKDRRAAIAIIEAIGDKIYKAKEQATLLARETNTYKTRYSEEPYRSMVDATKQSELDKLVAAVETARKKVHDENTLQALQSALDAAYTASLQCYREAHVAHAEAKSKQEEEERRRQQEAEERAKKEAEEKARKEAEERAAAVAAAERAARQKQKEEEERVLVEAAEKEITFPLWMDESRWSTASELNIHPNIVQEIEGDDKLKPSAEEWEAFFQWLEDVIEVPSAEVDQRRAQQIWQRKCTAQLALFLHFYRVGFLPSQIHHGQFGFSWEDSQRQVWSGAPFVYVPLVDGGVNWWCKRGARVSPAVGHQSTVKVYHVFQTSQEGVEEAQHRRAIMTRYALLQIKLKEAKDSGQRILEDSRSFMERYKTPAYQRLVKKPKEAELAQCLPTLERLLQVADNQEDLDRLKQVSDQAFALGLQCYQDAHVEYAKETHAREEAAREEKRLAEERERKEAEQRERDEAERQRKEEERARREQEDAERRERDAADRLRREEERAARQKEDAEKRQRLREEAAAARAAAAEGGEDGALPMPSSAGRLMFDLMDTLERFTAERILLIGRHLNMSEEEIVKLLEANQQFADLNQRRLRD